MTKPSEKDLEKAKYRVEYWSNKCWYSLSLPADREDLAKEFAAQLAAERASLPESVMKRLQDAVMYINQVPMDSDANLDNAEFEVTEAMAEIETWIKDGGG